MIIKKIIVKSFCFPFKLIESRGAILAYHSINSCSHHLSIFPELFEKQIVFLKKNNFHFLRLKDLNYPEKFLNKKGVLLTFDDGLEDNFTKAVPILKKYNVPADQEDI